MSEMKLLMEGWRSFLLEEELDSSLELHEKLIREFVEDLKTLEENKAHLNEILSKVGDFAKKAYTAYSDLKRGAIEKVLGTSIDSALKALEFVEGKMQQGNSSLIGKVKKVLNMLKKDENMTLAVSVVSIIIGLMTGEAFDVLEEVLSLVEAAPNLIQAYETISSLADSADMAAAVDKTGQLTTNLSGEES